MSIIVIICCEIGVFFDLAGGEGLTRPEMHGAGYSPRGGQVVLLDMITSIRKSRHLRIDTAYFNSLCLYQ